MNILLALLGGLLITSVVIVAVHIYVQSKRYNKFVKEAKPGDTCRYYDGEEAHRGIIVKRNNNITTVANFEQTKNVDILTVNTYPSW